MFIHSPIRFWHFNDRLIVSENKMTCMIIEMLSWNAFHGICMIALMKHDRHMHVSILAWLWCDASMLFYVYHIYHWVIPHLGSLQGLRRWGFNRLYTPRIGGVKWSGYWFVQFRASSFAVWWSKYFLLALPDPLICGPMITTKEHASSSCDVGRKQCFWDWDVQPMITWLPGGKPVVGILDSQPSVPLWRGIALSPFSILCSHAICLSQRLELGKLWRRPWNYPLVICYSLLLKMAIDSEFSH